MSHAGIVSKRLNVGSRKQHHVIDQGVWFFDAKIRWCTTPFPPEICAQSDPLKQFQTPQFRPISAYSPQPWELAKKVQALVGSHRWTVYVTPKSTKGRHKTRFCCFCQQNSTSVEKKSAAKLLCVKTFSGKVVATSFLYRSIDRLRATSSSAKNLRSKWPTPLENADFDRFRLIVPQPSEISKKFS